MQFAGKRADVASISEHGGKNSVDAIVTSSKVETDGKMDLNKASNTAFSSGKVVIYYCFLSGIHSMLTYKLLIFSMFFNICNVFQKNKGEMWYHFFLK